MVCLGVYLFTDMVVCCRIYVMGTYSSMLFAEWAAILLGGSSHVGALVYAFVHEFIHMLSESIYI